MWTNRAHCFVDPLRSLTQPGYYELLFGRSPKHGTSTGWYEAHAPDLAGRYEAVDPAALHNWLGGLLPNVPGTVLGAGSGRDAAWFSAQGYDVIAVEPASGMRSEGRRLHPDPRLRWINNQLPELSIIGPLAISFDVVMMTAVWQHVPPSQRDRAFRKSRL